MTTVFVAGSLSITKLHKLFRERLKSVVSSKFSVVIGDADGADASIQKALFDFQAEDVTVYCTGLQPRNNLGNWPVKRIHSNSVPGSRKFYTAKDIEMASVADYGLMMWDTKSTGTLNNVIELLSQDRSSRVFVNKEKAFVPVTNLNELKTLIQLMSPDARAQAEKRIHLSLRISEIENKQFRMAL